MSQVILGHDAVREVGVARRQLMYTVDHNVGIQGQAKGLPDIVEDHRVSWSLLDYVSIEEFTRGFHMTLVYMTDTEVVSQSCVFMLYVARVKADLVLP